MLHRAASVLLVLWLTVIFLSPAAAFLRMPLRGVSTRMGPRHEASKDTMNEIKPTEDIQINIRLLNSISEVSRESWNGLVGNSHPFLLYDWINALESSGCASAQEGWQPLHIAVEQLSKENKTTLVAAMPMYAKSHSYGEFIFDQSWADFAQRVVGIKYYPKLLAAVPFTPATGSRLMLSSTLSSSQADGIATAVISFQKELMRGNKLSGAHANFLRREEVDLFTRQDYALRQTVQYRWNNQRLTLGGNEQKFADMKRGSGSGSGSGESEVRNEMFTNFEDYLTCFKSKRRTQIKRERRSVYEEQGLLLKVIRGNDPLYATPELFQKMYEIYTTTIDKMWGQRYLSSEFFQELHDAPEEFKERIVFIVAYDPNPNRPDCSNSKAGKSEAKGRVVATKNIADFVDVLIDERDDKKEEKRDKKEEVGDRSSVDLTQKEREVRDPYVVENIIAGTINLVSDTHFYGRYWGALEYRKHLHFETCYYKSIEFCVDNGLKVLEPGAGGGEFKFLRGFNPFLVNSVHTFSSPILQNAVSDFLEQERQYNAELQDFLLENTSFGGSSGAKSLK